MPIARRPLAVVAVIVALLGWLIAGVQQSLHKADENFRRTERLYLERWLAEQKQALASGKLSDVYFYCTSDTDGLLGELAGMPQIRSLRFDLTDLTDKGAETIAELPNVTSLTLYGGNPRVSDAGLATLSHTRSLETLCLVNIDVTDDGLAALRSFPRLQDLTIYREPFRAKLLTDKAVTQLSTLQNLDKLEISGGWMSKGAIAELKQSLPNCYVVETKNWEERVPHDKEPR